MQLLPDYTCGGSIAVRIWGFRFKQVEFIGPYYAFLSRFLANKLAEISRHPISLAHADRLSDLVRPGITVVLDEHRELLNVEDLLQPLCKSIQKGFESCRCR